MVAKVQNIDEVLAEVKLSIIGEYRGMNKEHDIKCLICGREYRRRLGGLASSLLARGYKGCPHCVKAQQYGDSRVQRIQDLQSRGIVSIDDWDGTTMVGTADVFRQWKNLNCGHVFTASVETIMRSKTGCPVCMGTGNVMDKISKIDLSTIEALNEHSNIAEEAKAVLRNRDFVAEFMDTWSPHGLELLSQALRINRAATRQWLETHKLI